MLPQCLLGCGRAASGREDVPKHAHPLVRGLRLYGKLHRAGRWRGLRCPSTGTTPVLANSSACCCGRKKKDRMESSAGCGMCHAQASYFSTPGRRSQAQPRHRELRRSWSPAAHLLRRLPPAHRTARPPAAAAAAAPQLPEPSPSASGFRHEAGNTQEIPCKVRWNGGRAAFAPSGFPGLVSDISLLASAAVPPEGWQRRRRHQCGKASWLDRWRTERTSSPADVQVRKVSLETRLFLACCAAPAVAPNFPRNCTHPRGRMHRAWAVRNCQWGALPPAPGHLRG